jgi:hypothetical protein
VRSEELPSLPAVARSRAPLLHAHLLRAGVLLGSGLLCGSCGVRRSGTGLLRSSEVLRIGLWLRLRSA